jgi:hypothetical protein
LFSAALRSSFVIDRSVPFGEGEPDELPADVAVRWEVVDFRRLADPALGHVHEQLVGSPARQWNGHFFS